MERMTLTELVDRLSDERSKGRDACGVIVYSQDNWEKPFSLESRSYRVKNDGNAFYPASAKISNSMYGSALDGSDDDVRLDWYNWQVDYCYML